MTTRASELTGLPPYSSGTLSLVRPNASALARSRARSSAAQPVASCGSPSSMGFTSSRMKRRT